MLFALNYSTAAAELDRQGLLDFDCYKCPDWPGLLNRARRSRPVYVHLPLQAGRGEGRAAELDRAAALLTLTKTSFANIHLAPEVDGRADPFSAVEAAIVRTIEDVAALVTRFGPNRVVVENVPYWNGAGPGARLAVLPTFISQVVAATGCGLLLDLAHARIAALELGVDERAYITALPLHRLRELHVTGVQLHEGRLCDHLPLQDDDWALLFWGLKQIGERRWERPAILAFEYGGVGPSFAWRTDGRVLAAQVPRLARMLDATGARAATTGAPPQRPGTLASASRPA
jgi:uncharacterized protein (UPF0276 family)